MSDKWGRMVVLTDQVEAVDKTPDMTHVHVAEHINSLINKTREGINIGIEGGWGTGKSTVVAILLDLLKKTSENFAFYFDAWAHEGDHLRRAFLESLTDEILRLEGISDAIRTNLNHQKDLISNRIVRHEVRRKTTLTLRGMLSLVSAFLIPVGAELIAGTFKEVEFRLASLSQMHGWFVLGVVLTVLPIVVIVVNFLLDWRWRKRNQKRSREQEEGISHGFVNFDGDDEQTSETSLESERTSIEFERIFRELVSKLKQSGRKRFIIVVDNLDRVGAQRGLDIWSTLQIFSRKDGAVCMRDTYEIPLWIVVPYDGEAIDALWGNKSGQEGVVVGAIGRAEGCVEGRPAKAFLDKTFQVRVDVPELFVGNWSEFVGLQMSIAMPDCDKRMEAIIKKILGISISNMNAVPCMRVIKTYLNEIESLLAMYGENVSFVSICCYAAFRYVEGYKIADLKAGILKGSVPDVKLSVFPEFGKLKTDLAALIYGVSADRGLEFLLDRPVIEAIDKDDFEELKNIFKEHGEAFKEVVNLVPGRAISEDNGVLLWRWIGVPEHVKGAVSSQEVCECIRNNRKILIQSIAICPWMCVWSGIKCCKEDPKLVKVLLDSYEYKLSEILKNGVEKGRNRADEIKSFLPVLKEQGLRLTLQCVRLGLEGLENLILSNGGSLDGLRSCVAYDGAEGLVSRIPERLALDRTNEDPFFAAAHELSRNLNGDWNAVVNAAAEEFEEHAMTVIRFLYNADAREWSKDEASVIRRTLESRRFLLLSANSGDDDIPVLTYVLLRYTNSMKGLSASRGGYYDGTSERGYSRVREVLDGREKQFADLICSRIMDGAEFLFVWDWILNGSVALISEVLCELMRRECYFVCNVMPTVKCYAKAFAVVSDDIKPLLARGFVAKSGIVKQICEADDIWEATPNGVRLILEESDDKDLWARVNKVFGEMTVDAWRQEFDGNGSKARMVELYRVKHGEIAQLAKPYADALQQYVLGELSSEGDGETVARTKNWLAAMTTTFRKIVSRAIVEWCIIHRFKVPSTCFDLVLDSFDAAYEQNDGGTELSELLLDMVSQGQDVDLIRRIVEKLGRRVRLSREARQAIKKSFRSCEH